MRSLKVRIIIVIIGALLLLWSLLIQPLINRGTIAITISNNTSRNYVITRINDQEKNQVVESGKIVVFDYKVTGEGSIVIHLDDPAEKDIEQLLVPRASEKSWGSVLLTLSEKDYKITVKVRNRVIG